jgi:N-acetylglutamate synthase-like GNAT family acetyltransferase
LPNKPFAAERKKPRLLKSKVGREISEMSMKISYLADYPKFIPILAPEIVAYWRNVLPEETVERRIAKLRSHMNKDNLPIAWVAHSNDEVFGTAALRIHDLASREELTSWLAGVFVRKEYRRRGITSALCSVVEQKTWSLGFTTLYLFTPDQQSLYARLGWLMWERGEWEEIEVDIMFKSKGTARQLHPLGQRKAQLLPRSAFRCR